MFNSLIKLKKLLRYKILCGHEYTKNNLNFLFKYDLNNSSLKEKSVEANSKLANKLPTIPSSIGEELKTNIFLRCDNIELNKH